MAPRSGRAHVDDDARAITVGLDPATPFRGDGADGATVKSIDYEPSAPPPASTC